MKVYLVDFENVKSKGLTGIDSLTENDSVIIFYSENSDTISFEMHQKVLTSKAEVEYFKVHVGGKNALDFQLSTLLGFLVAKNVYSHIFVISNDRGFDFLHDFWHGEYVASPACTVFRTKTIAAAVNYANKNAAAVNEDTEETEVYSDTEQQSEETQQAEAVETPAESSEDNTAAAGEDVNAEEVTAEETAAPEEAHEIAESEQKKPQAEKSAAKAPESFDAMLNSLLSGTLCTAADIEAISKMIVSSQTKEELHNSLAKTFKQQATELYKLLRPKYLRLKALYEEENPSVEFSAPVTQEDEDTENTAPQSAEEKPVYHNVISARLAELLHNLCTEEELNKVTELFMSADTKQQLYIRMVKAFKKEKGCIFYNTIRSEYTNLRKHQEN